MLILVSNLFYTDINVLDQINYTHIKKYTIDYCNINYSLLIQIRLFINHKKKIIIYYYIIIIKNIIWNYLIYFIKV